MPAQWLVAADGVDRESATLFGLQVKARSVRSGLIVSYDKIAPGAINETDVDGEAYHRLKRSDFETPPNGLIYLLQI